MHGFIFFELKEYVVTQFESITWLQIMRKSGVGYKNYWPAYMYPDEEMFALINTASEVTRTDKEDFLEDFGIFLTPRLMDMYADLINPKWNTLDLIQHTESRIHTAVRAKDLEAKPPQLSVNRVSKDIVTINYRSSRKLCSLLKGIAQGVASHYNEQIKVTETSCMHKHNSHCTISIELVN